MELKLINNGVLKIKDVIKTIEDVENIKTTIKNNMNASNVTLKILDSFAMPSALIGYLIKLKQLEHKNVKLEIKDDGLYELMQDLNLDKDFQLIKL